MSSIPSRASRTQRVVPTLLAHLVPPERADARDAFVAELCDRLIPRAAEPRLATSVDVYCDEGAFTLDEARAVLGAAKRAGLAIKAHIGQFADLGGAELLGAPQRAGADAVQHVGLGGFERDQPAQHVQQVEQIVRVFRQPVVRLNLVERRRRATVADDRARAVAAAVAEPMPKHLLAGDFVAPHFRADILDITLADR